MDTTSIKIEGEMDVIGVMMIVRVIVGTMMTLFRGLTLILVSLDTK